MTSYKEHKKIKSAIAPMLMAADFDLVLFEHKRCDVTALAKVGNKRFVLGVEVERSARNVVENVMRNITAGCDHELVVCSNQKVMRQVLKKLREHLSESSLKKISITTWDKLSVEDLRRIKDQISQTATETNNC